MSKFLKGRYSLTGVMSQWLSVSHCLSHRPHGSVASTLFPAQEAPSTAVCILALPEQHLHKVGAQADVC